MLPLGHRLVHIVSLTTLTTSYGKGPSSPRLDNTGAILYPRSSRHSTRQEGPQDPCAGALHRETAHPVRPPDEVITTPWLWLPVCSTVHRLSHRSLAGPVLSCLRLRPESLALLSGAPVRVPSRGLVDGPAPVETRPGAPQVLLASTASCLLLPTSLLQRWSSQNPPPSQRDSVTGSSPLSPPGHSSAHTSHL